MLKSFSSLRERTKDGSEKASDFINLYIPHISHCSSMPNLSKGSEHLHKVCDGKKIKIIPTFMFVVGL